MPEVDDDALFGPEHVRVYRETAGEHGYNWRGARILLLTTTGRKSGEHRWVVIASKGGWAHDPIWFKNLEADPNATIEVMADEVPVRATVAEGEERERLWKLMTEEWPAYDEYQSRAERQIPVVVLERR
jgi:deazaflavin-dependent oxidoreductase (nitroreductase family)